MLLEPVDIGTRLQNEVRGFDSLRGFQVLPRCSIMALQQPPNLHDGSSNLSAFIIDVINVAAGSVA